MNTKKFITANDIKVLTFLKRERTAWEVADLLTIQNESACGFMFRLRKRGLVRSRKVVTKNKDSHLISRKKYSLTSKGKVLLKIYG